MLSLAIGFYHANWRNIDMSFVLIAILKFIDKTTQKEVHVYRLCCGTKLLAWEISVSFDVMDYL